MKKYLPSILASLFIALGVGALVAQAQSYVPLAGLPIGEGGKVPANYTISTYLSGAIKLLIAIGAALSILVAIIGGTQYVAAGISPDAKNDAKGRITNAFIGLTLILTSYLILNSINPKLVAFSFTLDKVTPDALETFPASGNTWDDSAVRSVLADATSIRVKTPSCTLADEQGQLSGCTSVYNLNGNAVTGLRTLYTNCKSGIGGTFSTCLITVTGGTEYWLHRSHGDGTRETSTKVDLAKDDASTNSYIMRNPSFSNAPCGYSTDLHYQPDGSSGGTYVDEPNRDGSGNIVGTGRHWHVCY